MIREQGDLRSTSSRITHYAALTPTAGDNLAWGGTGVIAVFEHTYTVHPDIFNAHGKFMGIGKGGAIGDGGGIKEDDVAIVTFAQHPTSP